MTRLDHALPQVGAPDALIAVVRAAEHKIVRPVVRELERRRTAAELSRLSDHLLDDIGVRRDEIVRVAADAAEVRGPAEPVLARLFGFLRRAWARKVMIRRFESLPDWLLEDLGIPRSRIPAAVDDLLAEPAEGTGQTAAPATSPVHALRHRVETAVRSLRQWNISRAAAGEMARLNRETLTDLGYVKGDVDWVPEVLAERRLDQAANRNASNARAA